MAEFDRSRGLSSTGKPVTRLEQIYWPVGFLVVAYGVRFGIRFNQVGVAEQLTSHLPPGAKLEQFSPTDRLYSLVLDCTDSPPSKPWSVFRNDEPFAGCSTLEAAFEVLEAEVQLYVAEMAADRVFVHAGVVGWNGWAILLPGRSFCGKSTLVAELVRLGADYYSDEYAVLDSTGSVHPYARPLVLRRAGAGSATEKRSPESLGGRLGIQPLPVGLVALSQFRPGGQWQPRQLSPGGGALALLANTVPARRIPNIVLSTLGRVVAIAPVLESERGEANTVAEALLKAVRHS
jgi:hypothetical protein